MKTSMKGQSPHTSVAKVATGIRGFDEIGGAFTANARLFLSATPKEHLEKPFDPTNLRAIVQHYLR